MGTTLETYSDVVNEVLNFGFNDGPQVNRERIKKWVNEALQQVAREVDAPEFQTTETITMQQGVYKYPLPTGLSRVQDIYYPELQKRLRPVDQQQFDTTAPKLIEGPPTIYTLYGTELWVFPAPNATGEELELRYFADPATLVADSDIPGMNSSYLHLLVEYALGRAFEAEDDQEAAQAHINRYKSDLAAFATAIQWRIGDRPRVVDGSWSSGAYAGRYI
jgi:hypothetical protein